MRAQNCFSVVSFATNQVGAGASSLDTKSYARKFVLFILTFLLQEAEQKYLDQRKKNRILYPRNRFRKPYSHTTQTSSGGGLLLEESI